MSRECPQPRQNNHTGGGQRTERDTLSGMALLPCLLFTSDVGNRVTSNEPLPTWDPVAPVEEPFGGDGGGGGW
jgi:hypothetical protein